MGCHFLPQGIFLTQGLDPLLRLLHFRWILYRLSHLENPQNDIIFSKFPFTYKHETCEEQPIKALVHFT